MKLEYSPYRLNLRSLPNAKTAVKSVEGVLVRRNGGYGCLQTWPSLGEKTWQEEWSAICSGNWSAPVARQLDRCLTLDARARDAGQDLFEGLDLPESYFSVGRETKLSEINLAAEAGFQSGKLKAFRPLEDLTKRLEKYHSEFPTWSWRVDFNGTVDAETLLRWLSGLSEGLKNSLRYLEDPCPSDVEWPAVVDVRFAEDRCVDRSQFSHIRILKPAIIDWRSIEEEKEIVLTTNFQHPVGMLFDWWEAAQAEKNGRRVLQCGLMTQHVFRVNPWSEALGPTVPRPKLPDGRGLGLGVLLEQLEWQSV